MYEEKTVNDWSKKYCYGLDLKNDWIYIKLYQIDYIKKIGSDVCIAKIDNKMWYVKIISLSDISIKYGFDKIDKVHYSEVDKYNKIFLESEAERIKHEN